MAVEPGGAAPPSRLCPAGLGAPPPPPGAALPPSRAIRGAHIDHTEPWRGVWLGVESYSLPFYPAPRARGSVFQTVAGIAWEALLAVTVGLGAGFIATLLGIGGGTVIVPLLVLAGFDIKRVVPASLVAVLGSSLGGLFYLHRRGLVDYRLALVLETATTMGALLGVWAFGHLGSRGLAIVFASALILSAWGLYLRGRLGERSGSTYKWPPRPSRLAWALLASMGAGMFSALLGIGGGVIKVPVLILVLDMPIKTAVSTSKLMVGITAAVGVAGHALKGRVDWILALPLALGTYVGASASSRLLVRLRARTLYYIAISYYIIMASYMTYEALKP